MRARSTGPRPDNEPTDQRRGVALVVLVLLTLVAFGLRAADVGSSLFADELGTYYDVAGRSLPGVVHLLGTRTWDLNPPFYYAFAWLGRELTDTSPQALRWISLLAGTASVPLTYSLGRRTIGREGALVAAGLIALDPFLVYFSSEARAFSLVVALCLGVAVSLLIALDTGARRWWAAYAMCACAAVYTQYTSVFVLLAAVVWAGWTRPDRRRPLLGASALAAVGFVPWLPAFLDQRRSPLVNGIGAFDHFGPHAIVYDLTKWAIGLPFVSLASAPGSAALVILPVGGVALVAGAALGLGRLRRRPATGTVLVIGLALAAPAGAALYSLVANSIWEPKDLIASIPGLALVVAAMALRAPRWLGLPALGLILLGLALGDARLLQTARQRPDDDGVARYVRAIAGPDAPIVEVSDFTPGPLEPMEVAVALTAPAPAQRNPVVRLGVPPLSAVLAAGPGVNVPAAPARTVALEAVARARGGPIFLVAAGSLPIAQLRAIRARAGASATDSSLAAFLGNVPARYRLTAQRTFGGFIPVSVYTFAGRAAP